MTTDPWVCPNTPRCAHPGLLHDIYDYEDPKPMCCADGCRCGQPKETPMTIEEQLAAAQAEIEQLRYERRLLGVARMTLDQVAGRGPERWDEVRAGAEDVAQRIVDEIGHPVTDEPALGPSFREEIVRLRAALGGAAFVSIAPEDLARYLDKWEDTLAFCEEYFTKSSEAAAAQHCNPKVFYSPICGRINEALTEVRRIKGEASRTS